MKTKLFFRAIAACLCACLAAGMLAACTQGEDGDGGENKGTLYSIQAPSASDVYTVTDLPEAESRTRTLPRLRAADRS